MRSATTGEVARRRSNTGCGSRRNSSEPASRAVLAPTAACATIRHHRCGTAVGRFRERSVSSDRSPRSSWYSTVMTTTDRPDVDVTIGCEFLRAIPTSACTSTSWAPCRPPPPSTSAASTVCRYPILTSRRISTTTRTSTSSCTCTTTRRSASSTAWTSRAHRLRDVVGGRRDNVRYREMFFNPTTHSGRRRRLRHVRRRVDRRHPRCSHRLRDRVQADRRRQPNGAPRARRVDGEDHHRRNRAPK